MTAIVWRRPVLPPQVVRVDRPVQERNLVVVRVVGGLGQRIRHAERRARRPAQARVRPTGENTAAGWRARTGASVSDRDAAIPMTQMTTGTKVVLGVLVAFAVLFYTGLGLGMMGEGSGPANIDWIETISGALTMRSSTACANG